MPAENEPVPPAPSPTASLPTGTTTPGETTGIQTVSTPASPANVHIELPLEKLPQPPPPIDAERLTRKIRRLDIVTGGIVLLLAFLLASFPARNSDLWMHLATGKFLAEGKYHFGVDPFAYTTGGTYWVNHAWLYNLVCYSLYQTLGGPGLIVLKALLVVLLAGVLLRLGWKGGSLWTSVACTGLAIVVMSPRLHLQPVCVSYLFLGLTLWFLERPPLNQGANTPRSPFLFCWPLFLLFAWWVNLDSWFLLGPLTVALYLIGQVLETGLEGERAKAKGERIEAHKTLPFRLSPFAFALPVLLAACLLNPHTIHAFTLPPQLGLSGAVPALKHDPLFRSLLVSPFQGLYFRTSFGSSIAGLAYFLLVLLGLLSFVLNYPGWRWQRALVWFAFFLLSAYQARSIPFFAVVAGPIMALNFQEFAGRYFGAAVQGQAPRSRWALWGRRGAVLAGLGLVVAAWPGWLQGRPYEHRGWTVGSDISLQQAAEQISRWRTEGKLGKEARGFNFSPDSANYFAWACPVEKGFFDHRLELFSQAAAEYTTIRQTLMAVAAEESFGRPGDAPSPAPLSDLRDILRRRKIDHVILYDSDLPWKPSPLDRLLAAPREWPLLYLDGRTAIFAWNDPARSESADAFASLRLDYPQQAFHPPQERQAPRQRRATFKPVAGQWWDLAGWQDAFLKPPAPRPLETDEAAAYLKYFDVLAPQNFNRHAALWVDSLAAGIIAVPAHASTGGYSTGPLATCSSFALRVDLANSFLRNQDDGPPGLALLAVRAARRALHANPDDAYAYLVLGEAYLHLGRNTRERVWESALPLLGQLRRVQAVVALNQALLLKSDLGQAHADLTSLYFDQGYQDLALKHLKEHLKYSQVSGRHPGESADPAAERIAQLEKQVDALDREVQRLLGDYEVRSLNLKVFERARLANGLGLAAKALDILNGSDIGAFGLDGLRLRLELLLATGQVRDVQEWMSPELKDALRGYDYLWLKARLAAATGDYDEADNQLQEMVTSSVTVPEMKQTVSLRTAMALAIGQAILDGRLQYQSPANLIQTPLKRQETLNQTQGLALLLRREADVAVLRGLLDLESGRTRQAATHFRESLLLWKSEGDAASGAGLDFPGRVMAQRYLRLLGSDR